MSTSISWEARSAELSRWGRSISRGTPVSGAVSTFPSASHRRRAPWRVSSFTPVSRSVSNRVRGVLPAFFASKRSARVIKLEVVDIYAGKLKRVRLQTVALLLGDVALAIWSLNAGHGVLCLVCLAGIIAIATWRKMRCEVCFQGLDAIVSRDCSPAGYRDVLEALAERDASDASLDPLTPRMQHLRDGTLRGLGAC